MHGINEIKDILARAIAELRAEGLEPDILLVGPAFLEHSVELLRDCKLRI